VPTPNCNEFRPGGPAHKKEYQYSSNPICTVSPTTSSYSGFYWVVTTTTGGSGGFGQITVNLNSSGTQSFNYTCIAED